MLNKMIMLNQTAFREIEDYLSPLYQNTLNYSSDLYLRVRYNNCIGLWIVHKKIASLAMPLYEIEELARKHSLLVYSDRSSIFGERSWMEDERIVAAYKVVIHDKQTWDVDWLIDNANSAFRSIFFALRKGDNDLTDDIKQTIEYNLEEEVIVENCLENFKFVHNENTFYLIVEREEVLFLPSEKLPYHYDPYFDGE